MTRRRTAILLCIIAAGVLAGAIAWHRLSRVTLESDPDRFWVQEGARVYAKMASAPVQDVEAIRGGMANATVEDAEGVLQRNLSFTQYWVCKLFFFCLLRIDATARFRYARAIPRPSPGGRHETFRRSNRASRGHFHDWRHDGGVSR